MKKFLIVIAFFALPAVCSAQLPIHKPNFGVKRQAASSPTVSLSGAGADKSSPISSNGTQTVTFNIKDMDESKGVSVEVNQPCHTSDKMAQQSGPGVYKLALTFDIVTSTDTCEINFRSVANSYTAEIRLFVAATQTDSGVATFEQAKSLFFRIDNGKSFDAPITTRQNPGQGIGIVIVDTQQGMIMGTIMPPNVIQLNFLGCMMQGTITGSTAIAKPMGAMPGCNGMNSVAIQAK